LSESLFGEDVIVRTIARLVAPFIQLFGLYVLMHGHVSPGGGFQAGVIIASSFILLALALGLPESKERFKKTIRLPMESSGPLIFALIGVTCILAGGYYLQYGIAFLFPPAVVSAILISAVEIGIGITVLAMIVTIFYAMAGD